MDEPHHIRRVDGPEDKEDDAALHGEVGEQLVDHQIAFFHPVQAWRQVKPVQVIGLGKGGPVEGVIISGEIPDAR